MARASEGSFAASRASSNARSSTASSATDSHARPNCAARSPLISAPHSASAAYRMQVAQNLLQRFWLETRAE
ncbi:MAG: hypothetical protein WBN99_05615, partial [Mycobacterium sp.]